MKDHYVWSCSVNIVTGEIERHAEPDDGDYPTYSSADEARDDDCFGGAGYASYNDDGFECVYAESVVSQGDADRLVREKCVELRQRFADAVENLDSSREVS